MKLLFLLTIAGCTYLPEPKTVAEYRDVCTSQRGTFTFGFNKGNSQDWTSSYEMRCVDAHFDTDPTRTAQP